MPRLVAMLAALLVAGCSPRLHRITAGGHFDVDRRELTSLDVAVQIDFDAKGGD